MSKEGIFHSTTVSKEVRHLVNFSFSFIQLGIVLFLFTVGLSFFIACDNSVKVLKSAEIFSCASFLGEWH